MKLVITIDTEEDNWGKFISTGQTLENIKNIPRLQELFDDLNVKPTYLITYPVATDDKSIALLRDIEKTGRCEIGTHCHPWNTPPFEEELSEKNSMLCNLTSDQQFKKLDVLHNTIIRNFDVTPVSFRSGRWGYDPVVAHNLLRLGYKVDTSITSYVNWQNYFGPDFSDVPPHAYRSGNEGERSFGDGLLELPATIAYLQQNFERCNRLFKILGRKPLSRLRLIGILDRLNLLNKVWLSPEMSEAGEMIRLVRCLMKKKYQTINMFFHSTTLKAGLNDYVRSLDDERRFLMRIKEFLTFTRDEGIESVKLADTLNT